MSTDLTKAPPAGAVPDEPATVVEPSSTHVPVPSMDGMMLALSAAEQLVAASPSLPYLVKTQIHSSAWAYGTYGVELAFHTLADLRAFAEPRGAAVSEWGREGLPHVHFEAVGAVRVGDGSVPFRGSALENRQGGAS